VTGKGPISAVVGAWSPRIKGVCTGTLRASEVLIYESSESCRPHTKAGGHRCCLQACIRPGQDPQVERFRSSMPFRAGELSPYLSSSLPLCVRFNQRLRRVRLIRWLQHSIRSLWLGATPAGFAPACQQTISVSLVHDLVTCWPAETATITTTHCPRIRRPFRPR